MTLYSVAGLTTKIELPVPLIVQLIPKSQKNQRPGITRQTPGYWVQHETANYNVGAGAQMHYRYLANGAEGQLLSFHFAVDDKVIYQMIPITEVTWQAADGAGPGNMSGISCELCVNQDSDWTVARHNAEALAAGVMKGAGLTIDRLKRHYDFNAADPDRHYCPKEMMTSGYWPVFVRNVGAILGGTIPMDTIYPPGMDLDLAKAWFGEVVQDGVPYRFAENGTVSNIWLNNGKATGQWPKLIDRRVYDVRTYFIFDNGLVIWSPGSNAGYSILRN